MAMGVVNAAHWMERDGGFFVAKARVSAPSGYWITMSLVDDSEDWALQGLEAVIINDLGIPANEMREVNDEEEASFYI